MWTQLERLVDNDKESRSPEHESLGLGAELCGGDGGSRVEAGGRPERCQRLFQRAVRGSGGSGVESSIICVPVTSGFLH